MIGDRTVIGSRVKALACLCILCSGGPYDSAYKGSKMAEETLALYFQNFSRI